MTTTLNNVRVTLHAADCRDVLRGLDDNSIDSVVTDPPYALVSIVKRFGGKNAAPAKGNDAYIRASRGFMGKSWDNGEVAFAVEFWAEVLRVLKPGGHVVAFSGTRTYHRMAVAIEDAGFEIRDQLAWVYGSGFPKSHSVPVAIDKASGVAPRGKAFNMKGRGDRAEELDANGRELLPAYDPITPDAIKWQGFGTALKPAWEPICLARKPLSEKSVAANVVRWGTGTLNIDGCRVGSEGGTAFGRSVDKSETASVGGYLNAKAGSPINKGRWPANIAHDGSDEVVAGFPQDGDKSAARFFYCAKASRSDRDEGLENMMQVPAGALSGRHDGSLGSITKRANIHPTVKPTDLMRWLCRLVTPPGGTVLDPFMGSGSTGKAAVWEGMQFVGCEREAEYMPIAEARIAFAVDRKPPQPGKPKPKAAANDNATLDLFGGKARTGGATA